MTIGPPPAASERPWSCAQRSAQRVCQHFQACKSSLRARWQSRTDSYQINPDHVLFRSRPSYLSVRQFPLPDNAIVTAHGWRLVTPTALYLYRCFRTEQHVRRGAPTRGWLPWCRTSTVLHDCTWSCESQKRKLSKRHAIRSARKHRKPALIFSVWKPFSKCKMVGLRKRFGVNLQFGNSTNTKHFVERFPKYKKA